MERRQDLSNQLLSHGSLKPAETNIGGKRMDFEVVLTIFNHFKLVAS